MLEEPWVKTAISFRNQKILNAVTFAAGAITDINLQRKFIDDTDKILKLSGEDRLRALRDLMSSVSSEPAVKTASHRFLSGKNPTLTLTNTEAAYINQEASWMFAQIGNDAAFQQRDWISKYFALSEREKAEYQSGDIISLSKASGPTAMSTPRPPTANQQRLSQLVEKRDKVVKTENELDRGTREAEKNDPESGDSTSYRLREKFVVENKVWDRKDGNKPPEQSRPNIYKSTVKTYQTFNQKGFSLGNNLLGGGLSLLLEAGKWKTFGTRMQAITEFLNERDALLKKIQNEMTHVVPDKPQVIEKLIRQIQEYARKSADPFEKQRAQRLLERLGRILEESYAWFGKQS